LTSSEDDDDVPLSKRANIISDKAESAKESMSSTAESDHTATPPPRTVVDKVKASTMNPSASASAPPSSSDHVSISFLVSSIVSISPRADDWLFEESQV
jgi:hypothetical protein